MFKGLTNIIEVDLSYLDTSKVTTMFAMFEGCTNIEKINFGNINTSSVKTLEKLFHDCKKLTSIDVSNFNTSSVTSLNSTFRNCESLTRVDVNNFDTKNVVDMFDLFSGCYSLTSADLSNFDTSKVTNMRGIFYNCSKLRRLDLHNFNTSSVNNIQGMFESCPLLVYININQFKIKNNTYINRLFDRTYNNIKICINDTETQKVLKKPEKTFNCSHECFKDNIKIDLKSNTCVENCNQSQYKYEYDNYCYDICPNNTYISNDNEYLFLDKKEEGNYYYDENKRVFKECYNTCKKCEEGGNKINNNCIECKNDFIFLNYSNYANNCYEKCQYYYYFNETDDYVCTLDNKCSGKENKLIKEKNKCIDNCSKDDIFKYEYNYICYANCPNGTNETNNYICNDIIKKEETYINNKTDLIISNGFNMINTIFSKDNDNEFLDEDNSSLNSSYPYKLRSDFITYAIMKNNNKTELPFYYYELRLDTINNKTESIQNIINNIFKEINITEIDNGIDKKIIEKDLIFVFTSTFNQKQNEDDNNITINLGQCENRLKNEYNISENDSLYILEIISEEIGMKIPKVDYEVYYPLYNNNLTKLNLTSCLDTKIEISIAVKLDTDLYKHNASSDYYNDICSIATSVSGTDISLKDRRNEFVYNNMTLCEENCKLIDYNYTKEKAKCSCDVKLSPSKNNDINKFNKKDFFKNFIEIKKIANLNVLKCYKTVLKIKHLLKNYGFFILFFILILYFIIIFIFWFLSYNKMKKDIYKMFIIYNKKEGKKEKIEDKIIKKKIKKKKKKLKKKKSINNFKNDNNFNNIIETQNENDKRDNLEQTIQTIDNKTIKMMSVNIKNIFIENDIYTKELIEQKDFELNELNYEEAIKIDHRNYLQYYVSLLKYNHPVMFSFSTYMDYNSRIIKLFLFFFSFSSDLTINALFFNDDAMHKIYEDKGKFNFLYQIPQVLYSTLISRFIDTLIKNLALSQDNIVKLKKDKKDLDNNYIAKLIRILKIKFISFFIIAFIIILFFWYYITCFCGIYINTQMHLIKDSLFSLILSLLLPFIIYLIPCIFRILALKVENSTYKLIYNFSRFIENYIA